MQNETQPSMAPHEILYGLLRELKYCDVLIDRMAGFPLQDEIEALGSQVVSQSVLSDPIFAESLTQAPLLVRLPWTETELLETYLHYAVQEATDPAIQTRTVCAFVFSTLDQATLGRRLTKRLDVPRQTGGSLYFRYFDPRVANHLPRILEKNQLSALLDGVQAWLHVGWRGQLEAIAPESPEAVSRFTLSNEQWRQMQCIEPFNLALRILQKSESDDWKREADIETRLLAAVRDAAMMDLSKPEDQAIFAAHAVRLGAAFVQHPRLSNAIEAAVQHDIPFADALAAHTGITPDTSSPHQISDQRAMT